MEGKRLRLFVALAAVAALGLLGAFVVGYRIGQTTGAEIAVGTVFGLYTFLWILAVSL
jgi:hypothetical protein